MNYRKMASDMGFFINVLTDRQLEVLQKAVAQETAERERVYREVLVNEYTDRLDNLADEIHEKGMTICYNGEPLDIRELSVE